MAATSKQIMELLFFSLIGGIIGFFIVLIASYLYLKPKYENKLEEYEDNKPTLGELTDIMNTINQEYGLTYEQMFQIYSASSQEEQIQLALDFGLTLSEIFEIGQLLGGSPPTEPDYFNDDLGPLPAWVWMILAILLGSVIGMLGVVIHYRKKPRNI